MWEHLNRESLSTLSLSLLALYWWWARLYRSSLNDCNTIIIHVREKMQTASKKKRSCTLRGYSVHSMKRSQATAIWTQKENSAKIFACALCTTLSHQWLLQKGTQWSWRTIVKYYELCTKYLLQVKSLQRPCVRTFGPPGDLLTWKFWLNLRLFYWTDFKLVVYLTWVLISASSWMVSLLTKV